MTRYEYDTSAIAVVLFDKGQLLKRDSKFYRHLRIKILSTAGTAKANFIIRTPDKGFISGYTFNLENGEIIKSKLSNANIYREEIVSGIVVYKIFFPDVKVGSVIDLEYSHFGPPFEWRFQDQIPVIHSELLLEETDFLVFKKTFYGFIPVKEEKQGLWVANHVPPLKIEPFMNYYGNYVTKFQFEIQAISIPGVLHREFATSWEKVGERLMEFIDFGGVFRNSAFLNDKAKELRLSDLSVEEKVTAAFDYIRDNIKWNGNYSVLVTREYMKNYSKNHSGNSAEVNLLLISLLKKANINAYPVVLSTRSNGLLNPSSPSISMLNHVIALVKYENTTTLLDATSPYVKPGVLPEQCLNLSAWAIIDTQVGEWINLNPNTSNIQTQFIKIDLNTNKEFVAEVTNEYSGFAYLNWIEKYEGEGKDDGYINYLQLDKKIIGIVDYNTKNIDRENLKAKESILLNMSQANNIQDIGREVFVDPFVLCEIENPFKAPERSYPIDFIYPRQHTVTILMSVPEGYEIGSLPEQLVMSTPDGNGKFTYLIQAINNVVTIRCEISIGRIIFHETDYNMLKNFYSEIVRKTNQPIQINKKT